LSSSSDFRAKISSSVSGFGAGAGGGGGGGGGGGAGAAGGGGGGAGAWGGTFLWQPAAAIAIAEVNAMVDNRRCTRVIKKSP
jgi:hypothetical protein